MTVRSSHGAETAHSPHHAPAMRLFLLGGWRVELAGGMIPPAAWGRRRAARTLVKLLALAPGHRLHREQILETLWPGADPDSALNSFGKALHAARRALEPDLPSRGVSSYLRLTGDILSLEIGQTWIDVDHFERLARTALAGQEVDAQAAAAAYTGELLPEDRYEEWTRERREELAALHRRMLLRLADTLEQQCAYDDAIDRLRQVLQHDPTHEDIQRRLMRLYMLNGSRHQALRQYQTCRAALCDELGVEPEPATEALHRDILAMQGGDAGALDGHERPAGRDRNVPLPAAVRRLPALPLVARERVLELAMDALDHAATGCGDMALIGGEAGVGKTRLVAEAAREGRRRGALILWGAGYEREGLVPYGPFVQALDDYIRGCPEDERTAVAVAYPELGLLIPALAVTNPAPVESAGMERGHLFAAVVRILTDLGAVRPVLLVLDDLHVADAASLQLLHHLARVAPDRRWLIVATYRAEDVTPGSEFAQVAAALTRAQLCRRIDLRRLARPDCDRVVAALLPGGVPEPALLERVYTLSLGNPLFAQELARSMVEQGALSLVDGWWRARDMSVAVPGQVRDLVEARVQGMGEDVSHTLALAAVAGSECSFAILRMAGGLGEAALLDALDRALEGHMLEEQGDRYAFPHPLFRTALYERLSKRRRAHLHGAVARAVEAQRPNDVEALAYHYAHSAYEEKAVIYLERAGDRAAAVYANEEAATFYQAAIERLSELDGLGGRGHTLDAARIGSKVGGVLTIMGRYDAALEALDRAVQAYRLADDLEGVGRAMAHIGRAHAARGTPDEGIARIEPLLDSLSAHGLTRPLAALHAALAQLFFSSGRYDAQLGSAQRAAGLARASGDTSILAEAELRRGTALVMLGRPDDGVQALLEAILLAETAGDLTSLSRALTNLTVVYFHRGDFGQAKIYAERALASAERCGDPSDIAFMLGNHGVLSFHSGDWSGARVDFERAVALARRFSLSAVLPYPLFELAQLCLAEGAWEEASRYLDESVAVAGPTGDLQAIRAAQGALAERDLLQDRPEEAHARLGPLLADPDVRDGETTRLRPHLAQAHLEMGDVEAAAEEVARGVHLARLANNRLALVHALQVQTLVAQRQGRVDVARDAVEEALALAQAMAYPYAEARALHAYGLLLAQDEEPGPARARLEEAQAILRHLGARPYLERTAQALAALRRHDCATE